MSVQHLTRITHPYPKRKMQHISEKGWYLINTPEQEENPDVYKRQEMPVMAETMRESRR